VNPTTTPPPAGVDQSAEPWLTAVLARGRHVPTDVPSRPLTAADRAAVGRDLRDGLLQPLVGEVVVGAGTVVDAGLRARALALLVPSGTVVVGAAAAWVHLGAVVPVPTTVVCVGARASGRVLTGGVVLELSRGRRPEGDVVVLRGLELTGPARTVVDVARNSPAHLPRVAAALEAAGLDLGDLPAALDRAAGQANLRAARGRLAVPVRRRDRPRPAPSAARP